MKVGNFEIFAITLIVLQTLNVIYNTENQKNSNKNGIIDVKYTLLKESRASKYIGKELTSENFYNALLDLKVKEPEIVLAQAQLETAYFKSRICRDFNNTLGLYNSKEKSFYKFDDWVISIIAYKELVEFKLKEDESYFSFIERLPYAEDPNYSDKIKKLIKRNKKWITLEE